MKLIDTYKSPNFGNRNKHLIKYIILHYTAMTDCFEAIEYLCKKSNKVSSHFLISKTGKIYHLVDIKNRAWHAGKSYWGGIKDLNSSSIGIEIDNSGHFNNFEKYTKLQIKSLSNLLKKLKKELNIPSHNILGHSDISPFRKNDPGEKFPWQSLNKERIVYFPKIKKNLKLREFQSISKKNNRTLYMLKKIGYDTRKVRKSAKLLKLLIIAYQRHFLPLNINGKIDLKTFNFICNHYKDILTLK
tara:strand:+ start:1083 stop:1814 length:732 start_codon:yes stop_codon:yes gene_type:complete